MDKEKTLALLGRIRQIRTKRFLISADYENVFKNISNLMDNSIDILLKNYKNNSEVEILKILDLLIDNEFKLQDQKVVDDIQNEEFKEKVECIIYGPSK